MTQIVLVIESVEEDLFWGRIEYDDDLIVESAKTIELLDRKMKKLLKDFHDLDPKAVTFDLQYDIAGLFDEKKYLNASSIAELAGINKSLMRQYVSGIKHPSYERAMHIQNVIREIGHQLSDVKVAYSGKITSQGSGVATTVVKGKKPFTAKDISKEKGTPNEKGTRFSKSKTHFDAQ